MEPIVNYYLDSAISDKRLKEIAGSNDSQLKREVGTILKTKKRQIYLFLSHNGKRPKVYTGLRIAQYYWDKSKQQFHTARYKESSPRILNEILANIRRTVIDAAMLNQITTKEDIRRIIEKTKNPKQVLERTFFSTFQEFIDKSRSRERLSPQGKYISHSTIKKYEGTQAHLNKFDKEKSFGVSFNNCNVELFEKLSSYFVNDLGLTDNSINKYLKTLISFLHYCEDQEYIQPRKMPRIVREKKGTIVSLSVSELFSLYGFDFKDDRLSKVRDVFCFQAFTGMSYTDVRSLDKHTQIRNGCIYYQRIKKGDSPDVIVPITEWTQSILDRYDQLPVISNQKYNEALKDMAKVAGFTDRITIKRFYGGQVQNEVFPKYEKITTHVGRKTCASVSADLGLERSVTKKILGHDTNEVHDHYRKDQDYNKRRFIKVWSKENIDKVLGESYALLKAEI